MAIFTRINGDTAGSKSVDAGRSFANTVIFNTGIPAPLTPYTVSFPGVGGNLAAELTTGGAVETVLRIVESNASILAYQVDAANVTFGNTTMISILAERGGWSAADLQTVLRTNSNIGAVSNVWASNAQVSISNGIKFFNAG